MNNYYVYQHVRNDTKEVFYVGKGRGERCNVKSNRNKHWHNIVNKANGFTVDIVFSGLSHEEALESEHDVILENLYFGCRLANKNLGGTGRKGKSLETDHKMKISCALKGRRLIVHNKETLEKISKKLLGRKSDPETVARIKSSNTGKKRARSVNSNHKQSLLDRNIYVFKHVNGECFIGLRSKFIEKYSLSKGSVSSMVRGLTKYAQGWVVERVKGVADIEPTCRSVNGYDSEIRIFVHDNGEQFVGTRKAFIQSETSFTPSGVCLLVNGKVKSYKGWRCAK